MFREDNAMADAMEAGKTHGGGPMRRGGHPNAGHGAGDGDPNAGEMALRFLFKWNRGSNGIEV